MSHLSGSQLRDRLEDAKHKIVEGALYFHYKDKEKRYKITGFCVIESTEEVGVKYLAMYEELEGVEFVRPLSEFLSTVVLENGEEVLRFEIVKE